MRSDDSARDEPEAASERKPSEPRADSAESADDAGEEPSAEPLIGPLRGVPLRRGRRGRDGPTAEQAAGSQRVSLRAAMVAAFDEHSYAELGVRELCERSGISSRDLYRHYRGGIYDCYVDCAERVTAQIVARVARAWRRGDELHERLSSVLAGFTKLVATEPGAARLALCEPFVVGPPAVQAMRAAEERLQKALIAEVSAFTLKPTETAVRAMFAGVVDLTRARLLTGSHAELPGLAGELSAWALYCLQIAPPSQERRLQSRSLHSPSQLVLARAARSDSPERARILAATIRLAGQRGYAGLTETAISRQARVSRRSFRGHFADKHAAFVAALETLWETALQHAGDIARASAGRRQGQDHAILALVGCLAEDPLFARLALNVLPAAAGKHGFHDRARLMRIAARALRTSTPAGQRPSTAASEATVAGAWAIISRYSSAGRPDDLAEVVHTVSRLALAPGREHGGRAA